MNINGLLIPLIAFSMTISAGAYAVETVEFGPKLKAIMARITNAKTDAEAAQAETEFFDEATPDQLAAAFGLAPENEADNGNGDYQAMIHEISDVTRTVIRVSIADQRLLAEAPVGFALPHGVPSTLGPIKISSAGRISGKTYHTRTGCFSSVNPVANAVSREYGNSPMPHALFYSGGFAIHGTMEENHLGSPASHGCVRISRANAALLYAMVTTVGRSNVDLCIVSQSLGFR